MSLTATAMLCENGSWSFCINLCKITPCGGFTSQSTIMMIAAFLGNFHTISSVDTATAATAKSHNLPFVGGVYRGTVVSSDKYMFML